MEKVKQLKLKGIVDTHIHLGQLADLDEFIDRAEALGLGYFSASVCDADFYEIEQRLIEKGANASSNLVCGYGLHPWLIDESTTCKPYVDKILEKNFSLISEVGLDKKRAQTSEIFIQQCKIFDELVRASSKHSCLLSIHAVDAAGPVLDVIVKYLGNESFCLHWFSGSSDELARARNLDLFFSVNARMLSSRRGKEYVRQLPKEKLLLESDWPKRTLYPEVSHATFDEYVQELVDTLDVLSELKDCDMYEQIKLNQELLPAQLITS